MNGVVLGCFILCLGLSSYSGYGVAAQSSELLDLLSPAAYIKSTGDKELLITDTTNENSRSLIGAAKCVIDAVLVVPRKIVAFIKRIVTAVYAFWVLVFRTIFKFYAAVFSTIGNTGFGIVNFYREWFGIILGVFF